VQTDYSLLQFSAGTQLAHKLLPFPHQDAAHASSLLHLPLHRVAHATPCHDVTSTTSPPASFNANEGANSNNTIFPRRKAGQHSRVNSTPVVLNEEVLRQLFTFPLHEAAVRLGISATAMKSACRKLGIKKWPYRSSYGIKSSSSSRAIARALAGSCSDDTSMLTSPSCSSASTTARVSQFPGTGSFQGSNSGGSSETFQGSNSGGSSPRNEHGEEGGDDDFESLTRDAALLAETMLMLQQGGSMQGRTTRDTHSPGGSSSCRDSSSNSSPPPSKRGRVSNEARSDKTPTTAKQSVHKSAAARQSSGNYVDTSSSSSSSSSCSYAAADSHTIPRGQMISYLPATVANVSALSAHPAFCGFASEVNSASNGATASVASLLN